MASTPDAPNSEREAEILLEVAIELSRVADEAVERARAAYARIGRPLPLFDGLDEEKK